MSTELNVIPSSALTEQEQADLNASIDSIIAAHKNDRQEINRLVFESVSAMTDSEGYEQELSSRKGLRRFWGAITGSNKRLQDKINSSRAAAQFAAQTTLQRFSEQNLLTFDLITAVNNKLNASMTAVEGEINQIYAALIQFFKQNRSDMIQLENRVANLQNNFSIEDVLDYYRNGLLCRWLKVRGYEKELKKVEEIRSEDSMGIIKELIRIFEIPCDPAEVEKSIYILKYKVESESENEQYKQESYKVDGIIEDYRQGYRSLLNTIFENQNDAAQIKAAIQEIVEKYKWVLQYDYRRVLTELIDQKMLLAVMCFLMNEQAREVCFAPDPENLTFPAGSDNDVLYEEIITMLEQKEIMETLGDNLKSFSGVTDGYWKDLKPKGQKYMLLRIGVGDFARSAGVIGGDLGSAQINGKFPVVDGIDYKSNSSMRTMLYMEV